jgi:acetyl esterase/lipase
VVFTPEYQSYQPPPDQILTGVKDAVCAVRYARTNAGEYGGDPDWVIVVGHSAGSAFGALISLAGDQFHGDCLADEGSAIPDQFIGLDGAYDLLRYTDEERLRMASPDEWVLLSPYTYIRTAQNRAELPFHLFVGKEMELLQDAQAFRDALLENGYSATLTQFPGVDHMYMVSGNHANTISAIVSLIQK